MNRKIIFFDIDGTILSPKTKHISESTRLAIKKAQANGNLAFINTGRTRCEIEKEITDIGFDGYICGCGTYISYGDDVLFHRSINTDMTKIMIEDLHKYSIEALLEGTYAIYYDSLIKDDHLIKKRDRQRNVYGFNVRDWKEADLSIDKLSARISGDSDMESFREKYSPYLDFICYDSRSYEIIQKGYTKATGIKLIREYLSIPFENTYAIGDSLNDLTMLQAVNFSIAMANSCDEVLKMASFITGDTDTGGIASALEKYRII